MGCTLKGKNLLRWKQIFSFMRRPKFIWVTTMNMTEMLPLKVYIFNLTFTHTPFTFFLKPSIRANYHHTCAPSKIRAPHAGANAWQQLFLENSYSKRGHNYVKKLRVTCPTGMDSPLIVNKKSEFQANVFINDRDIRKYQSTCTTTMSPTTTTTGLCQYLYIFSKKPS